MGEQINLSILQQLDQFPHREIYARVKYWNINDIDTCKAFELAGWREGYKVIYGQPILIDNEYYYPGEEDEVFFVIDEKNQIWSSDSTKYLLDKRMAKVFSQYADPGMGDLFAQIVLSMISIGLGYCNLSSEFFDGYTVEKENNIYYAKSNSNYNTFFVESNENNFLVLKRPYQIEGRITGGSVNVDGNSAVRRSCNLTFAISNDTIENQNDIIRPWLSFYASLSNRFKLEIGLKNLQGLNIENTNSESYPQILYDKDKEIFWFNQGEYICSSYSHNTSTNAINITISGKDYMCMLNGELGGTIESNVDFGTFEQIQEDGSVIEVQIPVVEIIKEAVHHYGGIPFEKIKIEEELLTIPGYALKEYRYDKPLYLFRPSGTDQYVYGTLNEEIKVKDNKNVEWALNKIPEDKFDNMIPQQDGNLPTNNNSFKYNNSTYYIHRIDYGETAGYEQMPLIYTGDLIAKPGENIFQIIDKIKNMLGEYEYFFDIEGNFIFQKRPSVYAYKQKASQNISLPKTYYIKSGDNKNYSMNPGDNTNFEQLSQGMIFPKNNNGAKWVFLNGNDLFQTKVNTNYMILNNFNWSPVTYYYSFIKLQDIPQGLIELKFKMWSVERAGSKQEVYIFPESKEIEIKGLLSGTRAKEYIQNYGKKVGIINKGESSNTIKIKNEQQNLILAFLQSEDTLTQPTSNSWLSQIEVAALPNYVFPEGKTMFTAFNNSYTINNIKNDFSIWGKRKGVSGTNIDIHGRFALQEKPSQYNSLTEAEKKAARIEYENKYHSPLTAQGGKDIDTNNPGGWREVLYQMTKDYMAFNHTEVYANSKAFQQAKKYQPYFTDMQGFWRQLYCPMIKGVPDPAENPVSGIEYDDNGWNKQINTAPWMLNFWIDFWEYKADDKNNPYERYYISKIGYRPKVLNDSTVTAIRYDKVPEIVFYEGTMPQVYGEKYTFNIANPVDKMFSTSTRGRTVFDAAESLKLNNIECAENISITSIPVYHLQPNTVVKIEEEEYLVTKLTIPLTYNGTMNITATKIIKTLPIESLVEYPNTGGK